MRRPKIKFLFSFHCYIQPTWYFNLTPASHIPYWIDYRKLDVEARELIAFDRKFESEESCLRDAAYQAWQKGIISYDTERRLRFDGEISIADEYRFIKKYYHPFWSLYILLVRLITFHNPFAELQGFLKVLNLKRVDLFQSVNHWSEYACFKSQLKENNTLVSVIIPTLNRYAYLKDVLNDLEKQDYSNIEVIVVDQSYPFEDSFYSGWNLDLIVIKQEERALWKARNNAIQRAKGDLILLYDDDSRVSVNWISEHLKCLDFFEADFSAGVSLSIVGAKIPKNYSFFRWADQLDTGNVMIRKKVFRKIGLFDLQFEKQRMGDGEFGLRAYLAGFIGISNPHANRIHLKVGSGGLREMGSWDGFRPTKLTAPRPIPSVLYLSRRYFGSRLALFDLLIKVPPSILPLRYKRKTFLLLATGVASVLLLPLTVCQVVSSWSRASQMMRTGAQIDYLTS